MQYHLYYLLYRIIGFPLLTQVLQEIEKNKIQFEGSSVVNVHYSIQ